MCEKGGHFLAFIGAEEGIAELDLVVQKGCEICYSLCGCHLVVIVGLKEV